MGVKLDPTRTRAWGAGALGALLVAGVLVAGLGRTEPANRVALHSGAAWLPSSVGQVALLSGASARPMAALAVANRGDALDVVQSGSDGYVVDRSTGTVSRVDGGTFAQSTPYRFAADDPAKLSVLLGGGRVYVLDGAKGLLYQTDPKTLAVRGTPQVLDATVTPDSATVDGTGRLWVIDDRNGALKWFGSETADGAGSGTGSRDGAAPSGSRLVLAGSSAVLVAATGADWLGTDGTAVAHADFGLHPDEAAVVSGTPDGRLAVVIAGRGVVELCTRTGCGTSAFPIDKAGARLGQAVLQSGLLFVPDLSHGTVHVLSTSAGRELAAPEILTPTADFDLIPRDGQLFYNDPGSDRAGVLHLDGTFTATQKYEPANPGRDVDLAAASRTAAPLVLTPTSTPLVPPRTTPPVVPRTTPPPAPARTTPPAPTSSPPAPVTTSNPPESTDTTTTAPFTPVLESTSSTSLIPVPIMTSSTSSPSATTGSTSSTTSTLTRSTTSTVTTSTTSTSSTTSSTSTSAALQAPTVGAIEVSGGSGGVNGFKDGDHLHFSVPTGGGAIASWAWKAEYATDSGVPQQVKATGSSTDFDATVDSGGSSGQEWWVEVTVDNAAGRASTHTTFLVADQEPATTVSDVVVQPSSVAPGAAVNLTATISGRSTGCTWLIDGGTAGPCSGSRPAPSTPGSYPVTVQVTTPGGSTVTGETTLTVGAPPTVSKPDCPFGPNVYEAATCTATATGTNLAWSWSATGGDRGSDPGAFTFTPNEMGDHYATITVTNAFGSDTATSDVIDVRDGTPPTHAFSTQGGQFILTVTDQDSGISGGDMTVVFHSECNGKEISVFPPESATIPTGDPTSTGAVDYPFAGGSCVEGTGKFRKTYPVWVAPKSITASAYDGEGLTWNYSGP